jgi:hypothetical protein
LDDIPKGQFICVYAGQLLTEQEANEDGKQFGDEYLAELDLIESIEQAKDGYESDVDIDIDHQSDISQSSGSGEIFFLFLSYHCFETNLMKLFHRFFIFIRRFRGVFRYFRIKKFGARTRT